MGTTTVMCMQFVNTTLLARIENSIKALAFALLSPPLLPLSTTHKSVKVRS